MSSIAFSYYSSLDHPSALWINILGWSLAILLPLLLAWFLRGKEVLYNLIAFMWVFLLGESYHSWHRVSYGLTSYLLCAIGSTGLIAWGLKEARKERINLGMAGFALTVLFFYFSNVIDRMGRSISLIGLGILFLLGGWLLERTRRRLVARVKGGES